MAEVTQFRNLFCPECDSEIRIEMDANAHKNKWMCDKCKKELERAYTRYTTENI